jgi:hypothetical protein
MKTKPTTQLPAIPPLPAPTGSARCEGWRRHGGAFTLGPVTWKQCEAQGIVTLKFKDPESGKVRTLPACKECWAECLATGVTIIEARPIAPNIRS